MDLNSTIRPVDRLNVLVNGALAGLWLTAGADSGYAPVIISAHLAGAGLPWLLARRGSAGCVAVAWLRELYPLVVVVAVWSELGLIREVMHASGHDPLIAAADLALFGRHLHAQWMPAMPSRWLSEFMFLVYFAYYPVVFLTPVILVARGRYAAARDIVFGLTVAYFACYALYTAFPVDGPSHTMVRYAGPLTDGFFYRFVTATVHAGDSMGTAFPSSHVVGAVVIALLAWRWFSRPVAAAFALEAVGVVMATVYTQNHFAIDVVAGVLLAVAAHWLLAPAARTLLSGSRARAPVPPLPVFSEPSLGEITAGGGS